MGRGGVLVKRTRELGYFMHIHTRLYKSDKIVTFLSFGEYMVIYI